MVRVLSIGEVMLELSDVGGGLYKKNFAGDTFNMAHYLNVVSGGKIQADYLTAVGEDAESDACLEFMHQHGVSITRCRRNPERTLGLFILSNDASGEKQYGYWRGQSAARYVFDEVQDICGYDLVYVSGITAAICERKNNLIESLEKAKQQGAQIVYDFNHRVLLWQPEAARDFAKLILPLADLIKISDEELEFLYADKNVAEFSQQYVDAQWVLTCGGEKGEVWQTGNMLAQQIFDPVKNMVDSSAAGDAFIATYIDTMFSGAAPVDCLKRAHRVASQVVCAKGSITPIDMTGLEYPHD